MPRIYTTSRQNPLPYDFEHTRNDTFIREFYMLDENGSPKNLTGFAFRMMIRQNVDDDSPVVTIPNGSFTISNGNGTNDLVTINHTETDFNIDGQYYYDIELTDAAGEIFTFMNGSFYVHKDFTR